MCDSGGEAALDVAPNNQANTATVKDRRLEEYARWGQDTTQARATLAAFQATLRFMLEDLARLEQQQQ